MNYFGLLIGIATLLIIGLGFPLVIRGERYLGYLWWPYMMGIGLVGISASLFISTNWLSVVIGVLGATFVWGSTELKEQAVRTELGWFPFNGNKIKPPFENIIKKWRAPHL
ncbi:MAG: DUF4491 family protein [Anaerolineales bacterium]|nr:DUF4491 family protein [Anaerolineales bacterium]MDP2776527.1 DUF4491 family protein [Anaerolineales bacterium]